MILDEARILIRTENLSKSYKLGEETKEAIKDVNMTVLQGEFVIIQGLNGKQKNVFFDLIGCLERPTSGKYYFDYEDIALAKADVLSDIRKNKLGYLFRDSKLIERMTAAQNASIPMNGLNISQEEKKIRLLKSLESFGIESFAGDKIGGLSEYQKQMVSLARAVVNNPLMIIADEPAANLDSKEEQKLMEHLLRLNNEGITIMLISRSVEAEKSKSFRAVSFEEGKVSEDKQAQTLSLVRKEA